MLFFWQANSSALGEKKRILNWRVERKRAKGKINTRYSIYSQSFFLNIEANDDVAVRICLLLCNFHQALVRILEPPSWLRPLSFYLQTPRPRRLSQSLFWPASLSVEKKKYTVLARSILILYIYTFFIITFIKLK